MFLFFNLCFLSLKLLSLNLLLILVRFCFYIVVLVLCWSKKEWDSVRVSLGLVVGVW